MLGLIVFEWTLSIRDERESVGTASLERTDVEHCEYWLSAEQWLVITSPFLGWWLLSGRVRTLRELLTDSTDSAWLNRKVLESDIQFNILEWEYVVFIDRIVLIRAPARCTQHIDFSNRIMPTCSKIAIRLNVLQWEYVGFADNIVIIFPETDSGSICWLEQCQDVGKWPSCSAYWAWFTPQDDIQYCRKLSAQFSVLDRI